MTYPLSRLEAAQARYNASQEAMANGPKILSIQVTHRLSESANDVPFLLDLARKQQAALDAVRELHKPIDSGDPRVVGPVCAACSEVEEEMYAFYPCLTIEALESAS
jgi:hypothetical protein